LRTTASVGLRSCRPLWFFSPKKTQPFQRVPVMARAMADSDLYGRPCHSKPSVVTVTTCSTPCHSRSSRVPVIGRSRSARMLRFVMSPPSSSSPSRSSRRIVSGFSPP
jgi:hypothetical protein